MSTSPFWVAALKSPAAAAAVEAVPAPAPALVVVLGAPKPKRGVARAGVPKRGRRRVCENSMVVVL